MCVGVVHWSERNQFQIQAFQLNGLQMLGFTWKFWALNFMWHKEGLKFWNLEMRILFLLLRKPSWLAPDTTESHNLHSESGRENKGDVYSLKLMEWHSVLMGYLPTLPPLSLVLQVKMLHGCALALGWPKRGDSGSPPLAIQAQVNWRGKRSDFFFKERMSKGMQDPHF